MCKHLEMRLLLPLFCFVLANKICISWMLFGVALINTCACFMRILRRDGLSICQTSLARLLVWLIVALMGKENHVGLTLTSHPQFYICLLVTNSNCFSKHGMHFSQWYNEISMMNAWRAKCNILCIIYSIHHCCLMHVFLLLEVKWNKKTILKNDKCRTFTKK